MSTIEALLFTCVLLLLIISSLIIIFAGSDLLKVYTFSRFWKTKERCQERQMSGRWMGDAVDWGMYIIRDISA